MHGAVLVLKPSANKLWSPVQNEREEHEPTDPVQGPIEYCNHW